MVTKRGGLLLLAAAVLLCSVVVRLVWQNRPVSGPGALPPPTTEPAPTPPPTPEPTPTPPPTPEPTPTPPPVPLVTYTGPIEHIFFHPLAAYPELAFDGDSLAKGYDDWFVTAPEFQRIVEQLYRNQYILVGIGDLFTTEGSDQHLVRKELKLPAGKKPLVLSIDDLNYYDYMRENGNVYKLMLNEQGEIRTLSVTPDHQTRIADDNEIVPILDGFVRLHPDFALNGAKGMINLTGYEGILGYRTNDRGAPNYEAEKAAALKVISRLKETGWTFASHGWGHLDAAKVSLATLQRDTQRWLDEVGPLVGPTFVYVYPFGASVAPGTPKFQTLLDAGFRLICAIGPTPYLAGNGRYMLMDRRHIDGMALETQGRYLKELFDAATVIDRGARHLH